MVQNQKNWAKGMETLFLTQKHLAMDFQIYMSSYVASIGFVRQASIVTLNAISVLQPILVYNKQEKMSLLNFSNWLLNTLYMVDLEQLQMVT